MSFDPVSYAAGKKAAGGGNPPNLVLLTATENATYWPEDYHADGFDCVDVEVRAQAELTELSTSENGTFWPPDGTDGFRSVVVAVPTMEEHTWTGTTLGAVHDNAIRAAVALRKTVFGRWSGTLLVGGNAITSTLPLLAWVVNGMLFLTGGASDGSQGCLFLMTGTGGNGLTAQQLYLIQSGTLTDLTAYGEQIISDITITLIY